MPAGHPTWLVHERRALSIAGWARELGMRRSTLWWRLAHGWRVDLALTVPVRQRHPGRERRTGPAPEIDGPALAVGGQWVQLTFWQEVS